MGRNDLWVGTSEFFLLSGQGVAAYKDCRIKHISLMNTPSESIASRDEHLRFCKQQALEYCATGDVVTAWTTLRECLLHHPETRNHEAIFIGTLLLTMGQLDSPQKMREFIEGCH